MTSEIRFPSLCRTRARFGVAPLAVLTLLFSLACNPVDYKAARMVAVNAQPTHEANLKLAGDVAQAYGADQLKAAITTRFPGLPPTALDSLYLKAGERKLEDKQQVFVEIGLAFSDAAVPANDILDYAQGLVEAEIAKRK